MPTPTPRAIAAVILTNARTGLMPGRTTITDEISDALRDLLDDGEYRDVMATVEVADTTSAWAIQDALMNGEPPEDDDD